MNSQIETFLKKLDEDEELLKKYSSAGNIQEKYDIAKGYMSGVSLEEFENSVGVKNEQNLSEMSDEELANTTGGGMLDPLSGKVKKIVNSSGLIASAIAGPLVRLAGYVGASNDVAVRIKNALVASSTTLKTAETYADLATAIVDAIDAAGVLTMIGVTRMDVDSMVSTVIMAFA